MSAHNEGDVVVIKSWWGDVVGVMVATEKGLAVKAPYDDAKWPYGAPQAGTRPEALRKATAAEAATLPPGYTQEQSHKAHDLIVGAAEAIEVFTEDELEEHASKKKG